MQTFFPLTKWSSCSARLLFSLVIGSGLGLAGCVSSQSSVGDNDNRSAFLTKLADDPAACKTYRDGYVRGFKRNVLALAQGSDADQVEAAQSLADVQAGLQGAGLTEADCSKPYCIIEPLQNGQLDSWCGYRIDADEGNDLYQWLDWDTVQAAVQR